MDAASFERVYDSLQEFHAFFAASFGRKQWRDHSGNYLQALLVQDQERRTAENLSESVGISARAMQRFLTEARWSDETVIGRLQEYLAPRLGHPEAVWVFDGSDFPKQGRKSAGVARQYCGRLGKVANCQGGMFLRLRQPRWAGRWWTSGCICPRVGPPTRTGVLRRVCRRTGGTTGQRRSWPWRCWSAGPGVGLPRAAVGCRRRRLRDCRRPSGPDVAALGIRYVAGPRAALRSGPWTRLGQSGNPGFGRPGKPSSAWAAADQDPQRGDELRMRLGG